MKETKADRTKAFILDKVSPIFNAKGYSATSLTDVLNATGLTKGSVYGNFENKEDLAQKAFNHNLVLVLKPLQDSIAKEKSATKKLKAFTDYYRNYYAVMSELGGCPLVNVTSDSKYVNEALYKDALNVVEALKNTLKEIIELGIKQKKFKKKTNAEELATLIYSMILGAVFLSSVQLNDQPLQITTNAIEDMIKANRKKALS